MTKETIRILEEIRKLSDFEWEEVKIGLLRLNEQDELLKKLTLERRVQNLIKEIGIQPNFDGYKYLVKAILICIEDPKKLKSVTKVLYPEVAKEFDSTWSRVERDMRQAIEIAFRTGNISKINEIFGYTYSREKGKIANSKFIAVIVNYFC